MGIISKLFNLKYFIIWLGLLFAFSFLIRLFMAIFKAIAIHQGEANYKELETNKIIDFKNWSFGKAYKEVFWSCSGDLHIDDYFLPTLVGLAELASYPALIANHKWHFIGFWFTVKTVAHWNLWQKSRTAFNRFLLGSLLSLFASFIIYWVIFRL